MSIVLGSSLDNGLIELPNGDLDMPREESVTSLSIGQYLIR